MLLFQATRKYLSMIRFEHSLFALPMAYIALVETFPYFEGDSQEFLLILVKISICMVFLRSTAMGFNRLVDRKYDKENQRTSRRELPSGTLSVEQVWFFVILCAVVFLLSSASINLLTGIGGPIVLILVCFYSYTKRFTWMCHFVLGLSIGITPLAVWIAVLERADLLAFLWSGGLMMYIAGFDILYSCQDADFDHKQGLHSIPAQWGIQASLWTARVSHITSLLFFVAAGEVAKRGWFFFAMILAIGLLLLRGHLAAREKNLSTLPPIFFHVNLPISTILLLGILFDERVNLLFHLFL